MVTIIYYTAFRQVPAFLPHKTGPGVIVPFRSNSDRAPIRKLRKIGSNGATPCLRSRAAFERCRRRKKVLRAVRVVSGRIRVSVGGWFGLTCVAPRHRFQKQLYQKWLGFLKFLGNFFTGVGVLDSTCYIVPSCHHERDQNPLFYVIAKVARRSSTRVTANKNTYQTTTVYELVKPPLVT